MTVPALVGGAEAAPAQQPTKQLAKQAPKQAARKVTLSALPPVVQLGTKPAKPAKQGVLSARFKPAKAGASVEVQKLKGKKWVAAGKTTQQAQGYVVTPVGPGTYRLVSGKTTTTTAVMKKWKPRFQDVFSGRKLGKMWRDQVIPPGLAGLRSCSQPSAKVRKVKGGTLQMGVAYDKAKAKKVCKYHTAKGSGKTKYLLNTQIVTEDTFTMTYGHVAARVKFSRSKGRHSGVWLAPDWKTLPEGALATEIDIAEYFGDTPRKYDGIAAFLHEHQRDGTTTRKGKNFRTTGAMLPKGQDFWNSYHVVSVEWTPAEYIFRLDGKEFFRAPGKPVQSAGYLVLSALTSDYEIKNLNKKNIKEVTYVDWIRVWDL